MEPNLQGPFAELESSTYNHFVIVVDRSMGDCRQPYKWRRTFLNFIKCIPTTFNAQKSMEKQHQN
ncbi:hypothetical protein LguiA_010869 [Lonicera macranthoides]